MGTTANTALLRGNNGNDTDGDKDKDKDTEDKKSVTKPDEEDDTPKEDSSTPPKKKKKKKKEDTPKEDEGGGYGINPNFVPADLPRDVNPNFVPADLPRFRCPEVLFQPNLTGPNFVPADLPRGVNPNFVPADLPRGDGMPSAQFKTDLRDGMPSAQFKTDLRDFRDGDTRDEEDMPPVYYDAPDDYFMDEEGVGQSSGGGSDRTSYIVIWDHEE